MTTLEIILAVVIAVLLIVVAYVLSGNVSKSNLLKNKDKQLEKINKSHYNLVNANKDLTTNINTLKKVISSFESNLPNSLYVKEGDIHSYRVKLAKEEEFEGVKEGQSVAYVRRKVHGKFTNVKVDLGIKIN